MVVERHLGFRCFGGIRKLLVSFCWKLLIEICLLKCLQENVSANVIVRSVIKGVFLGRVLGKVFVGQFMLKGVL